MVDLRHHLQVDLVISVMGIVKLIWNATELCFDVIREIVRDERLVEHVGDFQLCDTWLMISEVSFFDSVGSGFVFVRVHGIDLFFVATSTQLPSPELVRLEYKHGCDIRRFLE